MQLTVTMATVSRIRKGAFQSKTPDKAALEKRREPSTAARDNGRVLTKAGVLTLLGRRRCWFPDGPVGADGPGSDPLSVHAIDGVLSFLASNEHKFIIDECTQHVQGKHSTAMSAVFRWERKHKFQAINYPFGI